MITLLHGDYIEASRNELTRLKQKVTDKELREVDGRGLDLPTLTQALESQSLFGGDTVVVITNLIKALGRKSKQTESYTALLRTASESMDVLLWEDKEVSATMLKELGKPTVRLFKIPTVIFQFLDSIAPGGAKRSLPLYESLMESESAELVWAMLAKRMRQLLILASGETPEGLQGWQATRLTTQAKLFSIKKLEALVTAMAQAEYSLKTGNTPFALVGLTRQLLITL